MQRHDLSALAHTHHFGDEHAAARRGAVEQVTLITLLAMVVELAVGWWSGSLALLADGAHMGTHALALGGAALAYRLAERANRGHGGFAFGGWKIEVLAAYTSALVLAATALWLVWEVLQVLATPRAVAWREAMVVACLGLVVNLLSAWMLSRALPGHGHHEHHARRSHDDHHHGHAHTHHPAHHDHNFAAAYLHVLADALTSVLAIVALAAGAWFGVAWLDPAVALIGAVVIGRWAWGLLKQTGRALVDATADAALARQVREQLQADGDAQVADLHLWQVGSDAWCAALTVVADAPLPAAAYRQRLLSLKRLRHVTVEVHHCQGCVADGAAATTGTSSP